MGEQTCLTRELHCKGLGICRPCTPNEFLLYSGCSFQLGIKSERGVAVQGSGVNGPSVLP